MSIEEHSIENPAEYSLYVLQAYLFKEKLIVTLNVKFEACEGLFVTYKKDSNLRGCIGTFQKQPIREAIDYFAIKAAHDHRFLPICKREFKDLECTVSVLHSFEVCEIYEWDLSDGIIFEHGHHRSTFLPGIAIQQEWTKKETVLHLLKKARCHKVDLKDAQFTKYRSSVYKYNWNK